MDAFITYRKVVDFPDAVEGAPTDMTPQDFSRLVDFLVGNRIGTCLVRGNEATLHPRFADLIRLAQKKKVVPVVETCGLLPPEAAALLQDQQIPVFCRTYRPDFYADAQWREMAETCGRLNRNWPNRVTLCVVIDDPARDFDYVPDLVRSVAAGTVRLQVLFPADLERLRDFAEKLTPRLVELVKGGVRIGLGCGLPPCAFSDSDFGELGKLGVTPEKCLPRPGVLPDLRLYHCRQLIGDAGGSLRRFKRRSDAMDYFFLRYGDLQRDLTDFQHCIPCPSQRVGACIGECMVAKGAAALRGIAALREVAEKEDGPDALMRLGVLHANLQQWAEASECLTEARRVAPESGEIHLLLARVMARTGRLGPAEEEYEKAARLLPDRSLVLLEYGRMLEGCGKTSKARKILDSLPPPGPARRP